MFCLTRWSRMFVLAAFAAMFPALVSAQDRADAATCEKVRADQLDEWGYVPGMSFDSLLEAGLDSTLAKHRDGRRNADRADERLDRAPRLTNGSGLGRYMTIFYPPRLLQQRRGGRTRLLFFVGPDGSTPAFRVFDSSGAPELDLASIRTFREARFSPGLYKGCAVWVTSVMPITWEPGPPPRPY